MPSPVWTTALLMAVIFLATLIRFTLGFGEALVAVPLLAFLIPVDVVAPLAVLCSVAVAGVIILQDWRHVHVRSALRLVVSTLFGIPFGVLLLRSGPEALVKTLLGIVVAGFGAWALWRGRVRELHDDRHAWLFGVLAGILGGAYGMNGPPLVMYGAMRRWPPDRFRATLQGYFLPASIAGLTGYAVSGLWTDTVTRYFLLVLPAMVTAIILGRALSRRLEARRFVRLVYFVLMVSGLGLVLQAMVTMGRQDL